MNQKVILASLWWMTFFIWFAGFIRDESNQAIIMGTISLGFAMYLSLSALTHD